MSRRVIIRDRSRSNTGSCGRQQTCSCEIVFDATADSFQRVTHAGGQAGLVITSMTEPMVTLCLYGL